MGQILPLTGTKLGMTHSFNEKGQIEVCTVISLAPNTIVQIKSVEKDGYSAVQIGAIPFKSSRKKNCTKPLLGHFSRANLEPMRELFEARVEGAHSYKEGDSIGLDSFANVPFVDVMGTSIGKGFQGVMKRHGFKGGPASHGSGFHRHGGSTGMRSTPGRTLPGVKMPGRMGGDRVTVESLEVVRIDTERNCLIVKGAIPGAKGGVVRVRPAMKKRNKG